MEQQYKRILTIHNDAVATSYLRQGHVILKTHLDDSRTQFSTPEDFGSSHILTVYVLAEPIKPCDPADRYVQVMTVGPDAPTIPNRHGADHKMNNLMAAGWHMVDVHIHRDPPHPKFRATVQTVYVAALPALVANLPVVEDAPPAVERIIEKPEASKAGRPAKRVLV